MKLLLFVIVGWCVIATAQPLSSLRPFGGASIVAGLGGISGAHVGLRFSVSDHMTTGFTYGILPLQNFFGAEASIITVSANHFLHPDRLDTPFANFGCSLFQGRNTATNRRTTGVILSPALGFDALFGNTSAFVKLGLAGAFSNTSTPKASLNVEIGLTQRLW